MGAALPQAFPKTNQDARASLGGTHWLLGGLQLRLLGKEVTWPRAALPLLLSSFSSPSLLSCQRGGAAACRSKEEELLFTAALAEI